MFGNGLEKEVIIRVLPRAEEVAPSMFGGGGIKEYEYERLVVWAEKGYAAKFAKIPGVLKSDKLDVDNRYLVCVDPRYNLKWVMAEIEAVAKTEKPDRSRTPKTSDGYLGNGGFFFTLDTSDGTDEPKPKKKPKRKPRK